MKHTLVSHSAKPIFVLGSARSGTSIITTAIKSGANISGCNEGHFLPLISFLMQQIELYYSKKEFLMNKTGFMVSHTNCDDLMEKILEVFGNICDSFYEDEVWVDKTPDMGMIKASPYLLRIWPNARFIYAKRRGIECINSRLKKFPNVPFKTHCNIWKICMESWILVRESLHNHYIEVDQREIALNSELMSQKIGIFLDLDNYKVEQINNAFCNERPEYTGGKENLEAKNIEEFGWSEQQIKTFREICGSINKKTGYSETSSYYL